MIHLEDAWRLSDLPHTTLIEDYVYKKVQATVTREIWHQVLDGYKDARAINSMRLDINKVLKGEFNGGV
jgi:hypothetical protein